MHTLRVIADRPSLSLGTYTMFGKRCLEVPVSSVKFAHKTAAAAEGSTQLFKIEGYKYNFMLDGKRGTYIDHRLYNWCVTNGAV